MFVDFIILKCRFVLYVKKNIHFEYQHKQVEFYECIEIGCQKRKFDTFESLRRHFNLHHNIQEAQMSINQDEKINNQQENNVNNYTNNLDVDNDNFFGNDSFCDASNLNDLLNYNDSDLENCIVDKVTNFFAKLLSNYGLPHHEIMFKICTKKFKSFFLMIVLKKLKDISVLSQFQIIIKMLSIEFYQFVKILNILLNLCQQNIAGFNISKQIDNM